LKFEYRITLIYILLGVSWILFSDLALERFVESDLIRNNLQTYKGWFYVIATALIFFFFMKRHLEKLRITELELAQHKESLEEKVEAQTRTLDKALKDINDRHAILQEKNQVIHQKNLELEKAMQELKEAQVNLMRTEKLSSLGMLTRGLSHEINNPLNYISGGLVGLEDQNVAEINEETKLSMESIRIGLNRVSRIIRSLNLMSAPAGPDDGNCDPSKVLKDVLEALSSEFANKELQLINELDCNCYSINANDAELYQVFYNILKNAYKAVPEQGGRIQIKAIQGEKGCRFQIIDNGAGIRKVDLPRVTDPFFTTREAGQGEGLGLSIAFTILQKHKAEMIIHSEPDSGTEVIVEIPK